MRLMTTSPTLREIAPLLALAAKSLEAGQPADAIAPLSDAALEKIRELSLKMIRASIACARLPACWLLACWLLA